MYSVCIHTHVDIYIYAFQWPDLPVHVRAWVWVSDSLSVQYLCVCNCLSVLTFLSIHPYLSAVYFWLAVSLPVPVYWSTIPVPLPVPICQSFSTCLLSVRLLLFAYLLGCTNWSVGVCLSIHDSICLCVHICKLRFFL